MFDKTILDEKTVLVLGAGASQEFNFPLWNDLKNILTNQSNFSRDWAKLLEDHPNDSVDTILSKQNSEMNSEFCRIIVNHFIPLENNIKNEFDSHNKPQSWITHFCRNLMSEHIENPSIWTQLAANLNVVNLNYDRNFEYLFQRETNHIINNGNLRNEHNLARYIKDNELPDSINIESVHPHGSMAQPFVESYVQIDFTNYHEVHRTDFGSLDQSKINLHTQFYPVDTVKLLEDQTPYKRANELLCEAKNILIIGVSDYGLDQSSLEIPDTAVVHHVKGSGAHLAVDRPKNWHTHNCSAFDYFNTEPND